MNESNVVVTIRQAASGGFSAEITGHPEPLSAPDFESLLDRLREAYQGNGTAEIDEDDVADESFERDLDRIIEEDRELLKRLAQ